MKFFNNGYLIGFPMKVGEDERIFLCRVRRQEPIKAIYSFGSVAAGDSVSFTELKDGSNYYVVPDNQDEVFHMYWGITPSSGRIYFKEPSSKERFVLYGSVTVGDDKDYISGVDTPYESPTWEAFGIKDLNCSFSAYNPAGEAQIIKMSIIGRKYYVSWLDLSNEALINTKKEVLERLKEDVKNAAIKSKGGVDLVTRPRWADSMTGTSSKAALISTIQNIIDAKGE